MRSPLTFTAFLLGTCTAHVASAQSALPLEGDYVYGQLLASYEDTCGPVADLTFSADLGSLTFDGAGAFAGTSLAADVCPSGVTFAVDALAGTYALQDGGLLELDLDPAQPGTETALLRMSLDREVALVHETGSAEPALLVVLREAQSASQATLQGEYAAVSLSLSYSGSVSVDADVDLTTITFDGAGGWTLAGEYHEVTTSGTYDGGYTAFGTYTVTPNGTLSLVDLSDPGAGPITGRVLESGDLGFVVTAQDEEASLALLVPKAEPMLGAEIEADWIASSFGAFPGTGVGQSELDSAHHALRFDSTGFASTTGVELSVDSFGASSQTSSVAGTYTLGADGSFAAAETGNPFGVRGWVAAGAETLLFAQLDEPGYGEIGIGLRVDGGPAPFGTASPGAGGFAPTLAGVGGFPKLGNASFGLEVSVGLGGALTFVALALEPFPGGLPVLGGLVWIDPTEIFVDEFLTLSGPPGVPGTGAGIQPIPLPNAPPLAGLYVYAQAVVIEAVAPEVVALTQGLVFRLTL